MSCVFPTFLQNKTEQEPPERPYLIHFVIWGKMLTCFFLHRPAESGLPHQSTTGQWKLSEAFLSLSCTRPMGVRQKGLNCPLELNTASTTCFPPSIAKSPFSWMNNLKIWRTDELSLMVFFSILIINPLSLKGVVDLDRDAEMSTFYYKEKHLCRHRAGAAVTETFLPSSGASVGIMSRHKSF